uniref:uncharacterized protein LOC120326482 n=1 Tax=Styela clava TaxID=7725 RepID=UPI00193A9288|nr:uncharacterized protein LOC120326482 [Styela clava]
MRIRMKDKMTTTKQHSTFCGITDERKEKESAIREVQSTSDRLNYCEYIISTSKGDVGNKSQVERLRSRGINTFFRNKKWFLIILVGYFIGITEGYRHAITNGKQGENEDIFQIFGHTFRVQRSATRHHHYHHLSKRLRENDKESPKPVTRCPPPMTRLASDACTVDPCESDRECRGHGRSCCYNGCIYTCSNVVHPPPIIDWQTKNGKSNFAIDDVGDNDIDEYEGNMEFNILPGEMLAESHRGVPLGEICSTTIEEGDILLDCPHGYICHVENKGDPSRGLPNRGRCIAVTRSLSEHSISMDEVDEDYFY